MIKPYEMEITCNHCGMKFSGSEQFVKYAYTQHLLDEHTRTGKAGGFYVNEI